MGYMDYLNSFWRIYRQNPGLCLADAALYCYLSDVCNGLRWAVVPFKLSNARIISELKMDKRTLKAARARLETAGLIAYKPGGAGRHDCGEYVITNTETPDNKGVQNCTPNNEERGTSKGYILGVHLRGTKMYPDIIDNTRKERKEIYKEKKSDFTPPTIEETTQYFTEIGEPEMAQGFFNYNTGRGWQGVQDWRAIARLYIDKVKQSGKAGTQSEPRPHYFPAVNPATSELDRNICEQYAREREKSERAFAARHGEKERKKLEIPPPKETFEEICRENGISTANDIGRCFDYFSGGGWSLKGVKITNRDNLSAAVFMWKSETENSRANP